MIIFILNLLEKPICMKRRKWVFNVENHLNVAFKSFQVLNHCAFNLSIQFALPRFILSRKV